MDNKYIKYLKYKNKYLNLKHLNQSGGANCLTHGFQQYSGQCWHDALAMTLMQSDALKDTFIRQLEVVDLDRVHAELIDLFSPANIDRNAVLLPFSFYLFYLKNKASSERITRIINDFLRLSLAYIKEHRPRALNRLKYDSPRQTSNKENAPGLFDTRESLEAEISTISNPEEKTRLRRRLSISSSLNCTTIINKIYDLIKPPHSIANITSTQEKTNSYDELYPVGGNTYQISLAMEILNMYLIRSEPSSKDMYIDTFSLICSNRNPIHNYNLILKLFTKNLIGIHINQFIKTITRSGFHGVTFYKCDGQEILYDDNEGIFQIKLYDAILKYIESRGNQSEYEAFRDIIKSKTPYTQDISSLLFYRKRMFNPTDTEKQREIKFILNKFNGLLYDDAILVILFQRLAYLIGATKDDFHTKFIAQKIDIVSSSLFDMEKFKEIYGKYLNINMYILMNRENFNSMFI